MDNFQNGLLKLGTMASNNKYLSTIKDAFQEFMPFTIIGAIGVLWSNVLVNDQTGLGAIFKPVMALEFLNPAFNALNFATISCMTLSITFIIGFTIAEKNKINSMFGGLISLAALLTVTKTSYDVILDGKTIETVSNALFSDSLGSQGLFTGMIVGIITVELFSVLFKVDSLKIKMPDVVPPQIARSFEYLIPGFISLAIISIGGLGCQLLTGYYINDLIFNFIQTPLLSIGGSLPGILTFAFISGLFWAVGLHGDNMISGVFNPIVTTLIVENQDMVLKGLQPTHITNWSWYRIFSCTGGTGMVLSLALAIFLVGKRPENKSIAKLSFVANLFNIGEVETFGLPIVLNPILIIPFILAPICTLILGYVLTSIGFCPIMYLNVPWTMPPFLYGFIASGGNIMGGVSHLLAILLATIIYIPFIKMYEKQQALDEQKQLSQ